MNNEAKCPGCNKKLRADNTRGACSRCISSGKAVPVEVVVGAPRATTGSVRKQFKTVTAALGFDAEQLLEEFRAAWLARVKRAVGKEIDSDDVDNYALPAKKLGTKLDVVESARAAKT